MFPWNHKNKSLINPQMSIMDNDCVKSWKCRSWPTNGTSQFVVVHKYLSTCTLTATNFDPINIKMELGPSMTLSHWRWKIDKKTLLLIAMTHPRTKLNLLSQCLPSHKLNVTYDPMNPLYTSHNLYHRVWERLGSHFLRIPTFNLRHPSLTNLTSKNNQLTLFLCKFTSKDNVR